MIESLKRVFTPRTRPHELRECRRCGTSVDGPVPGCPNCGSDEIASYDL